MCCLFCIGSTFYSTFRRVRLPFEPRYGTASPILVIRISLEKCYEEISEKIIWSRISVALVPNFEVLIFFTFNSAQKCLISNTFFESTIRPSLLFEIIPHRFEKFFEFTGVFWITIRFSRPPQSETQLNDEERNDYFVCVFFPFKIARNQFLSNVAHSNSGHKYVNVNS